MIGSKSVLFRLVMFWTAGAGFVNYSDADNSNVLFQEKTLYTGITYDLTVDFDVNVGSNRVVVLMYGFDGNYVA